MKINSNDINELFPQLQDLCKIFIENCKSEGINVLITSTFRNADSQDDLYANGRTKPGNKVTNAKGGQSMHQFRCAFDFVPYINVGDKKVALWDNELLWNKCGDIGKKLGLVLGIVTGKQIV